MFDSNIHVQNNSFDNLKLISNKIKANNITRALCMFDNEKKFIDRKLFYDNCLKTNTLIPVATIRNTKNLKNEIENINKIGFKFIKFHPRNLNIKIGNEFYTKAFRLIKKTKLNIMWCTFDGWSTTKISEMNQLDFLSKLTNIVDNNKIILMHAGGPNILKFYEKFRFSENIFFDLSYTITHYENTSIEKDIIFLMNKFDKRILLGCDYPAIKLKKYLDSLNRVLKKAKIKDSKIKNILNNNLRYILKE